jgi:H+/Cl- antiporter ClcA
VNRGGQLYRTPAHYWVGPTQSAINFVASEGHPYFYGAASYLFLGSLCGLLSVSFEAMKTAWSGLMSRLPVPMRPFVCGVLCSIMSLWGHSQTISVGNEYMKGLLLAAAPWTNDVPSFVNNLTILVRTPAPVYWPYLP